MPGETVRSAALQTLGLPKVTQPLAPPAFVARTPEKH